MKNADERLVRLVAHHSCALCEARERGLETDLTAEFPTERPDLVDALIWCDMTTSPDGEQVTLDERLADIHSRYGPDHLVSRAITAATPTLRAFHRGSGAAALHGGGVSHTVSNQKQVSAASCRITRVTRGSTARSRLLQPRRWGR